MHDGRNSTTGSGARMNVTGPIAGRARLVRDDPPRKVPAGYIEEEWFLDGTATSYLAEGELTDDGHWPVTPGDSAGYTTRLLVRRPANVSRHNGTVVVEWLNVSGGGDADPDWLSMHRHLTRTGFAWVGVSAQQVGIEGGGLVPGEFLKQADHERYAALHHPGDRFCFDIFSQAGRAVRDNLGSLLGSLRAERMIATGESQSAICLTTYANAVAPAAHVFDGYFVHSRAGVAAALDGPFPTDGDLDDPRRRSLSGAVRIREDLDVPVLTLQSECDLFVLGSVQARQPDNEHFRLWEMAGTAHADTYILAAARTHDDDTTIEELADLCAPTTTPMGPEMPAATPINSGPQHHYIAQAAMAHLDRWVREGTPPPSAPRIETEGEQPVRDERGIIRGGIRTGFVDVPATILSGLGQEGSFFAFLFGTTVPFEPATLRTLYPGGRDEYAKRFAESTSDAVQAGFVLTEDAEEMNTLAVAMYPDPPTTTSPDPS